MLLYLRGPEHITSGPMRHIVKSQQQKWRGLFLEHRHLQLSSAHAIWACVNVFESLFFLQNFYSWPAIGAILADLGLKTPRECGDFAPWASKWACRDPIYKSLIDEKCKKPLQDMRRLFYWAVLWRQLCAVHARCTHVNRCAAANAHRVHATTFKTEIYVMNCSLRTRCIGYIM